MDETRRLLRYVVPGVLFGAETAFFLWILLPKWTEARLGPLIGDASIGAAVAGVLASGSLGYVLATAHHWLHWRSPTDRRTIDHSRKISDLRRRNLLAAPASGEIQDARLEALDAMTAEWFQRHQEGNPIGNATARATSLSDLAHAAGTARVASALALVTAVVVYMCVGIWSPSVSTVFRFGAVVVLGAALVALFQDTYRRTGGIAQRFYDAVLEAALVKERSQRPHSESDGS